MTIAPPPCVRRPAFGPPIVGTNRSPPLGHPLPPRSGISDARCPGLPPSPAPLGREFQAPFTPPRSTFSRIDNSQGKTGSRKARNVTCVTLSRLCQPYHYAKGKT